MTRARDLGDFIADGAAAELVVDTTTLVVDSTNNRVGIGTASPATALDLVGNATITVADNTDTLKLVSTDAGSNVGPNLNLYRNSSSPADNDIAGRIQFNSRNDNSQDVIYSEMYITTPDVSDGSEDGQLHIDTMVAGTSRSRIKLMPAETVFNENSIDLDFRVEGNGNANMLFVDAGNDRIGIGTGAPSMILDVDGSSGGNDVARFSGPNSGGLTFRNATSNEFILHTATSDALIFGTNGNNERFRIGTSGQLGIGGATYGTSGQVLTSGGSGAAPSWVDASGGGGIELTTSEAVVEGDRLAWNFTTGKVEKIARTGGFGAYSGTSARAAYYSMKEIPGTNKIFACVYDNSANQKKVMVIEQSTTDGSLTFGTPVAVSNQPQSNHYMDLVWCSNVNRMLVYYRAANYNMYGELFSVSGTTPTSTYSATISTDQNITEGYSPSAHFDTTANKAVIFYVGDASEFRRGVARVITPSASSFSVSGTQGPRSGSATNYFDASDYPQDFGSTFGNGVHVFNWASNGRYAVAATLSGTTLSFGSILTLNSSMNGRGRRTYTHYLSGASTNNRFAYPHGTGDDVFEYTNSGTTLSSISTQKIYDPQYSSYINLTAYQPSPADGGNPKTFAWSSASNNMKAAFDNEKQNDLYIDTSNGTGAQQVVKSSTSANLRTVCMQNTTGYSVCGDENGNIGYYQPIIDNFYYFVGCAKEAASANTTVKIANSGQVATGLSSLTAGDGYRINYSGGFSSQGSFQTDKTILNGSQRAGINGIALTTTTMLLINDFMYT